MHLEIDRLLIENEKLKEENKLLKGKGYAKELQSTKQGVRKAGRV
mgnify:FL=1